ncbi:MAG: ABC transporter substrate-binding protein [Reyranella sp.]|nr:ABC transporter substrate-binding protein [Reyranella sp.]MBR2815036.1 ABC transporter substrate-binding protein [Reyranella sp.]
MTAKRFLLGVALAALMTASSGVAQAEYSNKKIKIGVLNDQSGPFAYLGGTGSVTAAELAIADVGGKIGDTPIELVSADHQNKPDVGAVIAKKWFDADQVDAIVDVPVSSVALAVQDIGRQFKKTTMMFATTSELTGKACSPYSTHWLEDTYVMSAATTRAALAAGAKKWFFVSADYTFGKTLEQDASGFIEAGGGTVVGRVRHPLNTRDFSSFLLSAQASKADIIGLGSAGTDLLTIIKQANEFGIMAGGQKLAAFVMFAADADALGLQAAQGLLFAEGFYWDQNDPARAFSKRYQAKTGKLPTRQQAGVYAAVRHYLQAAQATGSDDAEAINVQMKKMPIDYFGHPGSIRADGRVVYPVTLYEVKKPADSKYAWDYLKPVRQVDADQAFRPLKDGDCPLVK